MKITKAQKRFFKDVVETSVFLAFMVVGYMLLYMIGGGY